MNPLVRDVLLATAGSGSRTAVLSPVLLIILSVGMWLLVCTLLGWMAGQRALLERYPPMDEPVEKSFRFASGSMRWVDFRNGLYVAVGTGGLHLAPSWPFRSPFFREVPCIPRSELRCVRPQG